MKKFFKSAVTLAITNVMTVSLVNAATYEVVPVNSLNSHEFTYGQNINDFGEYVINASQSYNFPIQYQYLSQNDFFDVFRLSFTPNVSGLESIQDFDSLFFGTPNTNDFSWILEFLKTKNGNNLYQQVTDIAGFVDFGNGLQEINIFDTYFKNTTTLTRSTYAYINGITKDGWIYGNSSAPALPITKIIPNSDTTQTYWARAWESKAFLSTNAGNSSRQVEAPVNKHGGSSAILDMNDNRVAVGYASVATDENVLNAIENNIEGSNGCLDPLQLATKVFEVCEESLRPLLYHIEAYKWVFNSSGQVIAQEPLGQLVTPHPDDTRLQYSVAQAINNNDVAVGYAYGWIDTTEADPVPLEARQFYAVIYRNGEVVDITKNHQQYYNSRAFDINDQGIAVGHLTQFLNGLATEQFYYIDTNDDDLDIVIPRGFFNGAASSAKAINEQGLVVGKGDIENKLNTTRRTAGFLYDIYSDNLTNLNDLLECNSPYNIIEANDINEHNEIMATAVVKQPRRNSRGEILVDKAGDPFVEDVVKAVILRPTPGEIVDCSKENGTLVVRQGASFGWLISLLSGIFLIRKRFFI